MIDSVFFNNLWEMEAQEIFDEPSLKYSFTLTKKSFLKIKLTKTIRTEKHLFAGINKLFHRSAILWVELSVQLDLRHLHQKKQQKLYKCIKFSSLSLSVEQIWMNKKSDRIPNEIFQHRTEFIFRQFFSQLVFLLYIAFATGAHKSFRYSTKCVDARLLWEKGHPPKNRNNERE